MPLMSGLFPGQHTWRHAPRGFSEALFSEDTSLRQEGCGGLGRGCGTHCLPLTISGGARKAFRQEATRWTEKGTRRAGCAGDVAEGHPATQGSASSLVLGEMSVNDSTKVVGKVRHGRQAFSIQQVKLVDGRDAVMLSTSSWHWYE